MTTTPRLLPGIFRDALDHGWTIRTSQDPHGITVMLRRWNRGDLDDPMNLVNISLAWYRDGHLRHSAINGFSSPLAQCRALIREGATP